jgi:hypothetical protein
VLVIAVSCVGSCKDLKAVDGRPGNRRHKWLMVGGGQTGCKWLETIVLDQCKKAVLFCKGERTLFKAPLGGISLPHKPDNSSRADDVCHG